MTLINKISEQIATVTGRDFVCDKQQLVAGGCINTAFQLDSGNSRYFVKHNAAQMLYMFAAESAGLRAIAETNTIRVPEPICYGMADDQSYLVMEYLRFNGERNTKLFGTQLAEMHRHTQAQFGFHVDNTIGSTHQNNTPHDDWTSFWQQRRLAYQLRLARQNGCGGKLLDSGERLLELIPQFFTDYRPQPAILHGDLWRGNYSYTDGGQPVIFDPATYYGDREVDIAMTELFGGFDRDFYNTYHDTWPLDPGYSVRKILYNLYHIINHFNLFGGSYLRQAETMSCRLLAEVSR